MKGATKKELVALTGYTKTAIRDALLMPGAPGPLGKVQVSPRGHPANIYDPAAVKAWIQQVQQRQRDELAARRAALQAERDADARRQAELEAAEKAQAKDLQESRLAIAAIAGGGRVNFESDNPEAAKRREVYLIKRNERFLAALRREHESRS